MTVDCARRLIRLYKMAEWNLEEFKKLSGDPKTQSKAVRHLQEAEKLLNHISGLSVECAKDAV